MSSLNFRIYLTNGYAIHAPYSWFCSSQSTRLFTHARYFSIRCTRLYFNHCRLENARYYAATSYGVIAIFHRVYAMSCLKDNQKLPWNKLLFDKLKRIYFCVENIFRFHASHCIPFNNYVGKE